MTSRTRPLPPLSKSGQIFLLSQTMRNILKHMQKLFCDICLIILLNKMFILSFLDYSPRKWSGTFLRTWFRNVNQWYLIISWLGGFNPKASRTWGWRRHKTIFFLISPKKILNYRIFFNKFFFSENHLKRVQKNYQNRNKFLFLRFWWTIFLHTFQMIL